MVTIEQLSIFILISMTCLSINSSVKAKHKKNKIKIQESFKSSFTDWLLVRDINFPETVKCGERRCGLD